MKNKYLTAEEANKIATDIRKAKDNVTVEKVISEIEKSAMEGKFSLTIWFDEDVVEKLKKLGYEAYQRRPAYFREVIDINW